MAVFTSFQAFVSSTYGQAIGNRTSKAYIDLLWEHLGSRFYTASPSSPSALTAPLIDGWNNPDARSANTIHHLTQVLNLQDIKQGDVLMFDNGINGHAGFSTYDYTGGTSITIYSQNGSVNYVALNSMPASSFLGGWRYDEWEVPPTPPTPTESTKTRFKWVLYARKLRNKRSGL